MSALSPSAQRVQERLDAIGRGHAVIEHAGSTRTAEEAAAAVGCAVAQIAKSLIFRAKGSGRPVLVVASGANRVDEKAVGRLIGETIERADPDFVREATGYAIGGVSPIGHVVPPLVLIDADLMRLDSLWAAAGTPNAVFRLTPADLVDITGGRVETIRKG